MKTQITHPLGDNIRIKFKQRGRPESQLTTSKHDILMGWLITIFRIEEQDSTFWRLFISRHGRRETQNISYDTLCRTATIALVGGMFWCPTTYMAQNCNMKFNFRCNWQSNFLKFISENVLCGSSYCNWKRNWHDSDLPSHKQSSSSAGSLSSLDSRSADFLLPDTSLMRNWTWSDFSMSSLLFFRSLRHFSLESSSSVLRKDRLFALSVEKEMEFLVVYQFYSFIEICVKVSKFM